jgi:DNA-binding transcriptional LysR family regulator
MLPRAHPGLVLRPLWTDRFTAIAPPGHVLARRRADLERLAAERLVVIRPGTLAHQVLASAFQSAGLTLVADLHVDNFQTLAEFVAAGAGVGLLPAEVARPALRQRRVKVVRVAAIERLERRLGLVLRAGGPVPAARGALVALLGVLRPQEQ